MRVKQANVETVRIRFCKECETKDFVERRYQSGPTFSLFVAQTSPVCSGETNPFKVNLINILQLTFSEISGLFSDASEFAILIPYLIVRDAES